MGTSVWHYAQMSRQPALHRHNSTLTHAEQLCTSAHNTVTLLHKNCTIPFAWPLQFARRMTEKMQDGQTKQHCWCNHNQKSSAHTNRNSTHSQRADTDERTCECLTEIEETHGTPCEERSKNGNEEYQRTCEACKRRYIMTFNARE